MSVDAWFRQSTTDQFNRNASLRKTCVLSAEQKESRENERRRYGTFGVESDAAEGSPVVGMAAALFLFALGLSGALLTFEDVIDPALNARAWYVKPQGTPLKLDTDHAGDTPSVSAKQD